VFNVGPMELLVLAIVGLLVIGPDKLPGLARDAGRMLRTLRDLATGAREQLREELGPEFADVDLRTLNPRRALQRAILGDEDDWREADPRRAVRGLWDSEDDPRRAVRTMLDDDLDDGTVSLSKPTPPKQRPLGRDEQAPFDPDAT
jgi:sec-independent protein translocase protein TatB